MLFRKSTGSLLAAAYRAWVTEPVFGGVFCTSVVYHTYRSFRPPQPLRGPATLAIDLQYQVLRALYVGYQWRAVYIEVTPRDQFGCDLERARFEHQEWVLRMQIYYGG